MRVFWQYKCHVSVRQRRPGVLAAFTQPTISPRWSAPWRGGRHGSTESLCSIALGALHSLGFLPIRGLGGGAKSMTLIAEIGRVLDPFEGDCIEWKPVPAQKYVLGDCGAGSALTTFVAALRHNKLTAPMVLEGAMSGEMFRKQLTGEQA
jgi:hypothetical protein